MSGTCETVKFSHEAGLSTTTSPGVAWCPPPAGRRATVVELLAAPRKGWTPQSWRERLLQLAERCEENHPDRAAELRTAAKMMKEMKHDGNCESRGAKGC